MSTLVSKVSKAPTKSKACSLKVTLTRNASLATVGGNVRVTLTKGSVSKVINAAVANDAASVVIPKLASGTWSVVVSYLGDDNFSARDLAATKLKVK